MKKMFTKGLIALIVVLMPKSNFAQIIELGSSANFTFFTNVGEVNNSGATLVYGNMGTNEGPVINFLPSNIVGQWEIANPTTVLSAIDLTLGYTYFSTRLCGPVLTSTLGNGQVLVENVYCIGSAIDLEGDLTFDAENDPNTIFIVKIDGALSVAANARVLLTNGAKYENIFWQVNGAVSLGEDSEFKGNLVVNGAINLLDGAEFYGKGLTVAGAINLNNNQVNTPLAPLAIKLSKFSVTNIGKTNKVNWTSLSEGDGDYFELERSNDANKFQKIATIPTKGSQLNYQFLDEFAPIGLSYYRLKMKELSGKFTYSQMVLANLKQNSDVFLTAYPNPVKDFLSITMSDRKESNNSINIVDITGKNLEFINLNGPETQVNMAKYSEGIYFVKYNNAGNSQTIKVIKQ